MLTKLLKKVLMMRLTDKYIPDFVYGSFVGIVTTFAVVAAATGAHLSTHVAVILGLANLFADGFSMGASAFLSHQAEHKRSRGKNPRHNAPLRRSLATFIAFVIVGFIPVAPYFFQVITNIEISLDNLFIVSSILTGLAFIWVGIAKGRASGSGVTGSIVETFVLGVTAATLAYFVGAVFDKLF